MGAEIGLIALWFALMPPVLLAAGFLAGMGSSGSTIVVLSTISARVDERFLASALRRAAKRRRSWHRLRFDLVRMAVYTLRPEFVFAGQAVFAIASALVLLAAKNAALFLAPDRGIMLFA